MSGFLADFEATSTFEDDVRDIIFDEQDLVALVQTRTVRDIAEEEQESEEELAEILMNFRSNLGGDIKEY